MRQRFFILVFLFSGFGVLFAQDDLQRIDSLKQAMDGQSGAERVETLIELSRAFFSVSFDECIATGEQAISEANHLGDRLLEARALWKMGLRYMYHYDLDLAKDSFLQSIRLQDTVAPTDLLVDALNYLGRTELFMGQMDAALNTYLMDMRFSEKLGDTINCADVTNNIAFLYFQQGEAEMAFEYFTRARRIYEAFGDTLSMAHCDNNIGNIRYKWNEFDEARRLLLQAKQVLEYYGDDAALANVYQNLGTICANNVIDYDSALYWLEKSKQYCEMSDDKNTLTETLIEMGHVYLAQGDVKRAIGQYEEALQMAQDIDYGNGQLSALTSLGIACCKTGDYDTSIRYLHRCLEIGEQYGIKVYRSMVIQCLILDYAHLGRFADMEDELSGLIGDYDKLLHENNILANINCDLDGRVSQLSLREEQYEQELADKDVRFRHGQLIFHALLGGLICLLLFMVFRSLVRKR